MRFGKFFTKLQSSPNRNHNSANDFDLVAFALRGRRTSSQYYDFIRSGGSLTPRKFSSAGELFSTLRIDNFRLVPVYTAKRSIEILRSGRQTVLLWDEAFVVLLIILIYAYRNLSIEDEIGDKGGAGFAFKQLLKTHKSSPEQTPGIAAMSAVTFLLNLEMVESALSQGDPMIFAQQQEALRSSPFINTIRNPENAKALIDNLDRLHKDSVVLEFATSFCALHELYHLLKLDGNYPRSELADAASKVRHRIRASMSRNQRLLERLPVSDDYVGNTIRNRIMTCQGRLYEAYQSDDNSKFLEELTCDAFAVDTLFGEIRKASDRTLQALLLNKLAIAVTLVVQLNGLRLTARERFELIKSGGNIKDDYASRHDRRMRVDTARNELLHTALSWMHHDLIGSESFPAELESWNGFLHTCMQPFELFVVRPPQTWAECVEGELNRQYNRLGWITKFD